MRPLLIAPCLLIACAGARLCGADVTPAPPPAPAPAPAKPHPRVMLGITFKEPDDGQAKSLDIFPPAIVASVSSGCNAERLGIKVGDTITALNGHAVANVGDVVQALSLVAPGDAATVVVTRDGKPLTLTGAFHGSEPGAAGTNSAGASGDDGAVMP